MNIVIIKRSDDYHASIEDRPQYWGNGRTPREAIRNLMTAHSEIFGVKFIWKTNEGPYEVLRSNHIERDLEECKRNETDKP